ncbi:MAG: hypothetical protein ACYCQI_01000 [Gammaproteobacteria bacterium]
MISKRTLIEKPDPEKIIANFNELIQKINMNLSLLTECATGSAFQTSYSLMDQIKDRSLDDKVKEQLAALDSLMRKFNGNVENFRRVKENVEEKTQTTISHNIKQLSDTLDGVINQVKKSHYLANIENYKINLKDIQTKLTYSWQAIQPYEPPKLSM